MLKILQVMLQQYENWELLNVQAEFRKGRGARDQIANIRWIIKKSREFQKNTYFCFIDPLNVWITTNCGKFLEMGIPDHLTCLLRHLHAGQEATFRTRHGTLNCFQTGKGVPKSCILPPCLFNLCAEYFMCKTRLMKHKLDSRWLGKYQ